MLPPRYRNNDEGTFGKHTAFVRWPILIQNAIDDTDEELAAVEGERATQGALIRDQLAEFKREVERGDLLRKFTVEEVQKCNIPSQFNDYLTDEGRDATWHTAEWLFSEVYMYRRINTLFGMQPLWTKFDIFDRVKQSTFKSSFHGVVELALRFHSLSMQLSSNKQQDRESSRLLFREFVDISLWGNATDLSLLTNATLDDIKSIQGAEARKKSESNILVNDTDAAFDLLWDLKCAKKEEIRVDFVLDNSGFELFADLMLVGVLIQLGLATKCVFHCKDTPFMVSDTMLKDYDTLVHDLSDRNFFPTGTSETKESRALDHFVKTLKELTSTNKLELQEDSFWTIGADYWNIDPKEQKYRGAIIHKELSTKSELVIFKGDLNYRKLTGDRRWPRTTPWRTAIGPLANNGIRVLSLRTAKADVQVGLPEGVDEKVTKLWETTKPGEGHLWMTSGKWATICLSDSKNPE